MNVIPGSETAGIQLMLVFVYTANQILCDTNVDCCACDIGENVDVVIHSIVPHSMPKCGWGCGLPRQCAHWLAMTW